MKQFIIIFFCLFFSTNVFAKDFYRYFGFGQSTGSYEESKYNLDEDLSSDSYVYGNYFDNPISTAQGLEDNIINAVHFDKKTGLMSFPKYYFKNKNELFFSTEIKGICK